LLNVGSAGAALEKTTGKVIWTSGTGAASYSTHVPVTLGGQKVAAILTAHSIAALDLVDGKVLWRFPWQTPYGLNVADPIVAGAQVFVSSSYGKGCGLIDLSGGEPALVWENKEMINHFNTCVLINGHLYGINCDTKRESEGNLRCIEWKTGEVKWSH